jgi:hypothetical protein
LEIDEDSKREEREEYKRIEVKRGKGRGEQICMAHNVSASRWAV